jgi:hypothetical protein
MAKAALPFCDQIQKESNRHQAETDSACDRDSAGKQELQRVRRGQDPIMVIEVNALRFSHSLLHGFLTSF